MKIAIASDVPPQEQNREYYSPRPGATLIQRLLDDETADGFNFRIIRAQFQPGDRAFRSPRHRHAFQQIRFTEQGTVNHGPGIDAPQGDITYFPKGAYYGPQEKPGGIGVTLQFGFNGEHQMGRNWEGRYRARALELLEATGSFEDGVYTQLDPETGEATRHDAVQVIYEKQWELHTGRKFVVPAPGYEAPIQMHPAAFAFHPIGEGVEIKRLGQFFDQPGPDGDVRISIIRLSPGGSFTLSSTRAQIGWTLGPGLVLEDADYPERTFVYSPLGEECAVGTVAGNELYLVEFPSPGGF